VAAPPKIEFIYPDRNPLELVPKLEEVEAYISEIAEKEGVKLPPSLARKIAERILKRITLVAKRSFYVYMILKFNEAYSRGNIPRSIYVSRVSRYVEKLSKVDAELQREKGIKALVEAPKK